MSSIYDISGTTSDSFSMNNKCTFLQGDENPQAYLGQDGDVYFQSNGNILSKRNGTWESMIESSMPLPSSGVNKYLISNGINYEFSSMVVPTVSLPTKNNQVMIASPTENGWSISMSDVSTDNFNNLVYKNTNNDFTGRNTVPTPTQNNTKDIVNVEYVETKVAEAVQKSGEETQKTVLLAVPTGTIIMHASNSTPSGYLPCDGGAYNRTTYANLFRTIGTTYGVGNNSTTFNVPDLRDRFALGSNGNNLGTTGGEATHQLTIDEMPTHTHTMNTLNVTAYDKTYKSGNLAQGTLEPVVSSPTGGNQPHNNMPPYVVIRYYIKY